jgi:predicted enzyme related to lactoylglutathione lyase
VADVVSSANYYRDKLGFQYDRIWHESFCMVRRSGVVIMLAQFENAGEAGVIRPNHLVDPERGAWDAYIWIDNAAALSAEFKAKGVEIVRDICDQDYGCRDFEVKDCNGYRLAFGQRL